MYVVVELTPPRCPQWELYGPEELTGICAHFCTHIHTNQPRYTQTQILPSPTLFPC